MECWNNGIKEKTWTNEKSMRRFLPFFQYSNISSLQSGFDPSFQYSTFPIFHILMLHYSNVPPSLFFFCAPLKNPLHLLPSLDEAWKQGKLTLQKKHHPRDQVGEEISAPQFIDDLHGCLMESPFPLDALNKRLVKEMDILLLSRNSLFDRHFS